MAKVTVCSAKHDGEFFEEGTPFSELPKALQEHMKENDLLKNVPAEKKAPKKVAPAKTTKATKE
jgi:hypothetical protein